MQAAFLRVVLSGVLIGACAPSPGEAPGGTGGTPSATGGRPGTGGATPAATTGGAPASTGGAPASTGGVPATGGTSGSGGASMPDSAAEATSPPADASDAAPMPGTASAGCAAGVMPLAEGAATFMVGGATRHYTVRLPTGYGNTRPWPVVLALPPNGNGGAMSYWDATDGARALRPLVKEKAILVIAQALPGGPIGRPGFDWRERLPQELAYFEALLTLVKSRLCVDESRIFSMGFSGGGSFSGVLGCARKDIRAIAVAGSVVYFDPQTCVGSPAAWVAISAGDLSANSERYRDTFRTRAMCQATTSKVPPADCTAYACPAATPVHYCPYPGGHTWPSFGTEGAWDFFSKL